MPPLALGSNAVRTAILSGLVLSLLVSAVAVFRYPATPDVGWYLHVAGALADGAELHRDFWEVNPPLIVRLTQGPVAVARVLGLDPLLVFRIAVLSLISLVTVASYRILNSKGSAHSTRRASLAAAGFCFVLVAMTGEGFGQRDHLFAILSLPYVLAAAEPVLTRRVRVAAGVAAGIGVALKPHFVVLPLLIETYAAIRERRLRLRTEAVALLAVLACYGIVLLTLEREWFRIAALVMEHYDRFSPIDRGALAVVGGGTWLLVVLVVAGSWNHGQPDDARVSLTVAALAGLISLVAQGKGFAYHWIPLAVAAGCALVLAASSAVALPRRPPAPAGARGMRPTLVTGVLVLVVVVGAGSLTWIQWAGSKEAWRRLNDPPVRLAEVRDLVRLHAPGGSIYSFWAWPGFPLVNYDDVGWGSTFQSNWLLPAIVAARRAGHPNHALEATMMDVVHRDLAVKGPSLLLVDRRPRHANLHELDFIGLISSDARIERELRLYCRLPDLGRYAVYVRRDRNETGGCP